MAKTAQENAGYFRRGGLVGDAKSGNTKFTSTSVSVGKSKSPSKAAPPSKGIKIAPPTRPTRPPISGGGGPTKTKTVTVGAKSKAPSKSQSPVVTHVNATYKPPKKKKTA